MTLKSINGSKTKALELTNLDEDSDCYKLTASSLLKKKELPQYFNPPFPPLSSVEDVLNTTELGTRVCLRCLVLSENIIDKGKSIVYNYSLKDNTGEITMVSFMSTNLDVNARKIYLFARS